MKILSKLNKYMSAVILRQKIAQTEGEKAVLRNELNKKSEQFTDLSSEFAKLKEREQELLTKLKDSEKKVEIKQTQMEENVKCVEEIDMELDSLKEKVEAVKKIENDVKEVDPHYVELPKPTPRKVLPDIPPQEPVTKDEVLKETVEELVKEEDEGKLTVDELKKGLSELLFAYIDEILENKK